MQQENLSIKLKIYRKICTWGMHILPDKLYLTMLYQVRTGEKIDWKNPKSFNEKLNWLKLYDRRPEYMKMADKYEVREYIREKLGEEYLIPVLGVWDKAEDIDFEKLPDQFVLKCTHDSGSVIICKDKETFDEEDARSKLKEYMSVNYFYYGREWPYKKIKPRIIAEKYMVDESNIELKDYKIFCFNGEPEFVQVDFGRYIHHERNLYTTEWTYMDEQIEYPKNPKVQIARPDNLEEMLQCAKKLAQGIPTVRIDFYSINGKTYFGEITFYHGSGFETFEHEDFNKKLGDLIRLPQ